MTIGFRLESGNRHRPQPRAPAQAFARVGYIDIGRPRHRARAVEPFDALDRGDLRHALSPRPGIDGRSLIAGVDGELGQPQLRAVLMGPGTRARTEGRIRLDSFFAPPYPLEIAMRSPDQMPETVRSSRSNHFASFPL